MHGDRRGDRAGRAHRRGAAQTLPHRPIWSATGSSQYVRSKRGAPPNTPDSSPSFVPSIHSPKRPSPTPPRHRSARQPRPPNEPPRSMRPHHWPQRLSNGAITAAHIDAVTRTSKRLDGDKRTRLIERADALAAVATAATVDQFAKRLELEAKRLDTDDGSERLEHQRRAVRARTWVDPEGMWNLTARLDPLTGVKIAARLDVAVESLFAESYPTTAPPTPSRNSSSSPPTPSPDSSSTPVSAHAQDVPSSSPSSMPTHQVSADQPSSSPSPSNYPPECSPHSPATPTSPPSSFATASCSTHPAN